MPKNPDEFFRDLEAEARARTEARKQREQQEADAASEDEKRVQNELVPVVRVYAERLRARGFHVDIQHAGDRRSVHLAFTVDKKTANVTLLVGHYKTSGPGLGGGGTMLDPHEVLQTSIAKFLAEIGWSKD